MRFVFFVLTKYPPGDRYCYRTRFRSGRNAAVHRSAKDALQVPALLYGAYTIPVSRLLSFPSRKTNFKRKKQDRNALAHGPIPTGRKGKVGDKAHLFNQFSVNLVIFGRFTENMSLRKTQIYFVSTSIPFSVTSTIYSIWADNPSSMVYTVHPLSSSTK